MRHNPGSAPDEVTLVTRVRTNNKGNQALSAAWLDVVQQAFPGSPVRLLERRPRHLLQYTLAQLASARDPFRQFDALTDKLAAMAPGPGFIGAPIADPRIALDERIPTPTRFADLRARLNLRGWVARAGRYRHSYLERLAAFQRSRFVIINPAGEFFPRSPAPAFYYLIEAHVAHKLGRPTAIVNHTMDVDDKTLHTLIPRVYKTLEMVGFRDTKSIDSFRAMGGDLSNVVVSPDLALTTRPGRAGTRRRGTIAVAINVPEAVARGFANDWIEVVRGLQRAGFEVVLVSNEFPADAMFYERVKRETAVRFEGGDLDFAAYGELLGAYDVVVSSRMHTAILAMVGGAPVVAVEGASFKITGLYQELGLSRPVIRPSSPGWIDAVVAQSVAVREARDAMASEVASKLGGIREKITNQMVPRLRAAEARAA